VDNTGAPVAGYSYDPYGVLRASTGTGTGDTTITTANPLRYTAGYRDDSGLYKLGFRYYDATLGRFTQPDPSGQEQNPYLYAAADPINATDSAGLNWLSDAASDVGSAFSDGYENTKDFVTNEYEQSEAYIDGGYNSLKISEGCLVGGVVAGAVGALSGPADAGIAAAGCAYGGLNEAVAESVPEGVTASEIRAYGPASLVRNFLD
jgi:RHS repeat-associated protein